MRNKLGPYKDHSGEKYFYLTVLWPAGWRPDGDNKRIVWACQCDCGNVTVVYFCDLKRGRTKSCGCNKIVSHNANARALFSQYKGKSLSRGYEWGLTFEQFVELTSSDCYYTGWKPSSVYKKLSNHAPYMYNGIDRVNNEVGYILENCVPCNGDVNRAKLEMSKERFLDMCRSVTKTQENIKCQKDEGTD